MRNANGELDLLIEDGVLLFIVKGQGRVMAFESFDLKRFVEIVLVVENITIRETV